MSDVGERVMVIDDDPVVCKVMKQALEGMGNVKVVVCSDAYTAAMWYEKFSPQLILLDMIMKGKDGPAVLKMLRGVAALKDVPVVFVTGVQRLQMTDDYRRLGVIGIIHKPFGAQEFLEKIIELWAECRKV